MINSLANPNVDTVITRNIDKQRSINISTFTHKDVIIDPEYSILKNDKLGRKRRRDLKRLLKKYKNVFRSDVGCVIGEKFTVRAQINEDSSMISTNKKCNYLSRYPSIVIKKLREKLLKELADGFCRDAILQK